MEDDGMFYGHLVHFKVFCYILWAFGVVHGNLVYFLPFWYFVPRKIWQPWCRLLESPIMYLHGQNFSLLLMLVLQVLNLQQPQRCRRLERFVQSGKIFLFQKCAMLFVEWKLFTTLAL
jgi:hypothetical protein